MPELIAALLFAAPIAAHAAAIPYISFADPNTTIALNGLITTINNLGGVGGGATNITALTGDVTASGSGSVPATLATVNSSPGSTTCSNITTNGKGLVTANTSGSCSGGGGTPGGTSGQIQYNNAGAFGGFTFSGGMTVVPSTGVATLGNPGVSTLGGIESVAAVSHEWINSISTAGVPGQAQPAFTDLSGSASAAQIATNLGSAVSTLCSGSTTNFVRGDGTCVAPSGSSVSITAATPNLVVTPSPLTGTGTVGLTQPITDQSGAGTAIVAGYNTEWVDVGAFTYTIAQAGTTGFASGWGTCLLNTAASGNATVNATTSVFKGASGTTTLTLAPGDWVCPTSDGTNYTTIAGHYVSGSGSVTGTGTANAIPKWTSTSAIGNSAITDNGTLVNVTAEPLSVSQAYSVPSALTDGATIAVNAALSNNFTVTIAGNRTLSNPTNLVAGQILNFQITQDATGNRTLAFGANYNGAISLNPAANAVTMFSCYASSSSSLQCAGGASAGVTASNCSSGASPAVCGSARAGSVAVPTGATPTLVIDSSAVTATSEILLNVDESATIAGTTCNTTLATLVNPVVTARSAGTSFTIQMNSTLAANPACVDYQIVN